MSANLTTQRSTVQAEYGSSPRHACFVPGTPFVLVQNEYDSHLCSYALDRSTGVLTRISRVDSWDPDLKQDKTFSLLDGKKHPGAWTCSCIPMAGLCSTTIPRALWEPLN